MAKGADGSIIIDTALDSSGFNAGSAKLSKACDSLINKVGNMSARLQGGFVPGSGLDKMAEQTATVQHEIDVLQEKLKALGDTPIKTDDYAGLEQALKKAENELLRYQDRQNLMRDMGIDEASAQWQRLAIQISNTEAIIRQYRAEMAYLEQSGQATIEGSQTEQFTALQRRIAEAKERLREFNAEQNKMVASGARLERVSNAFKRIGEGIKNAIKRLFSFNRASRSSAGATNGLIKQLTSLKTLLVSRIKQTFITQIINAVRESLQVLARYSREFNASISGIRNAFKELGANISVALSGILNAVAPIVTQIINWLSKIITYISAFIAMLSGKNTITVAKKQNESYAKSLDKTAKAANKAQLALAGFDELNNLTTQKDSGGSGAGISPGSLFEEKEVNSILPGFVKNWFEKLKRAIQDGDWRSVGKTIAEGLNAAVNSLDDWIANTLVPKGVKMASNLAQGINGFFEKFDSRKLGQSIAHGINAAVGSAKTFLEETDFQEIGASTMELINGAMEDIDWGEVGATASAGVGAILDTIDGALSELDWDSLATAVEDFIMGVDWGNLLGKTLRIALRAALFGTEVTAPGGSFFKSALGDLPDEAKELAQETITGWFDGLKPETSIGQWCKDYLLTPFVDAIKKWFQISSPSKVTMQLGGYVSTGFLDGIKDKLKNVAAWVQNNIFTPVKNAVSSAFGIVGNAARKFLDVGSALVAGVKNGINNAWSAFKQWVEGKFSGIIDGVKSVFGIHSPSKVFAQIGKYLMAGLTEGIDDEKATVLRSIADIAAGADNAFDDKSFSVDSTGFDGLLTVLDRIAEKIGMITDSLGNLRIPAIATGEVIPYRAKIVDTTYAGGVGDGGDLKQIIIDALRALGLDNTTIQVLLDGQKVYDSVVDYSKRDIRRTGRYPILGE